MAKIKILYTIPNFDTAGSGKAMLNIIQRLDKDIFSPEICCFHPRGSFFKMVEDAGFPIHLFQYTAPMKPRIRGLYKVYQIARFLRSIKPDIIHSFHYSSDYSEALAARLAGARWVFTKKNMNWGGASKNSWKLRSSLANAIIVQNKDMIDEFYPHSKKTALIPRGVDLDQFKKSTTGLFSAREFGLPTDTKIIISVANLVPVKGIETLIHSYNNLHTRQKTHLLIVGDNKNEYGEELKKLVNDLSLNHRITFTGKRSDVASLLERSYLFVLPTLNQGRKEGSPVAVLEAMAKSKLVLGSRIPGIKDQLAAFPFLLFKAGDSPELTEKIEWALTLSPPEYREITEKINHHVSEFYNINMEVKRHETLYHKLLK
ncbi:MAG: glycosyltransferase [Acidobacteria bacterium]|nr:MAG: glycosyltransferase [Acidobacteriota bacterium]